MYLKNLFLATILSVCLFTNTNSATASDAAQQKAIELSQKYGMPFATLMQEKLGADQEKMFDMTYRCAIFMSIEQFENGAYANASEADAVKMVENQVFSTYKCQVLYLQNVNNQDVMDNVFHAKGDADVAAALSALVEAYKSGNQGEIAKVFTGEQDALRKYVVDNIVSEYSKVDLDAALGL